METKAIPGLKYGTKHIIFYFLYIFNNVSKFSFFNDEIKQSTYIHVWLFFQYNRHSVVTVDTLLLKYYLMCKWLSA